MCPTIRDVAARAGVSLKTDNGHGWAEQDDGHLNLGWDRALQALDRRGWDEDAVLLPRAAGAGELQGNVEVLRARPADPAAGEGRW